MASRTITITDAAYARLAAAKGPGESFTDVVLRLTQPRAPKLSEVHRLLGPDAGEGWARAVEERRRRAEAARAGTRGERVP